MAKTKDVTKTTKAIPQNIKSKFKPNKRSGDAIREIQQIISDLKKKGIVIKPTPLRK